MLDARRQKRATRHSAEHLPHAVDWATPEARKEPVGAKHGGSQKQYCRAASRAAWRHSRTASILHTRGWVGGCVRQLARAPARAVPLRGYATGLGRPAGALPVVPSQALRRAQSLLRREEGAEPHCSQVGVHAVRYPGVPVWRALGGAMHIWLVSVAVGTRAWVLHVANRRQTAVGLCVQATHACWEASSGVREGGEEAWCGVHGCACL